MHNAFLCVKIDHYEEIYEEVVKLDVEKLLNTWFRIDARPFLQALLNDIKKWSYMFKQHLIDHVTHGFVCFPTRNTITYMYIL